MTFSALVFLFFFPFSSFLEMFASFLCPEVLQVAILLKTKFQMKAMDSQVKSISSVQLCSERGEALIELKCIAVINAN